jgi:hypothetical protein
MHKYLFAVALFSTSACVRIAVDNALYEKYSAYKSEANEKSINTLYSKYFSSSLLRGKKVGEPEVSEQLLFKNYMKKTHSHFEKTSGERGCLTVNGFDENNTPLVFNIEYVYLDGSWFMNDVNVLFLGESGRFSGEAKCLRGNVD